MMKTYHGSCECGKIRFQATFDTGNGSLKCNCSMCFKSRFWLSFVAMPDFKLTQGDSELGIYTSKSGNHHHFCRHCGVKLFNIAKARVRVAISLSCLDDLAPEELAAMAIRYVDGLHDRVDQAPAFVGHL